MEEVGAGSCCKLLGAVPCSYAGQLESQLGYLGSAVLVVGFTSQVDALEVFL